MTITANNTFTLGQSVTIAGITPVSYDGTFTLASVSATQFTYTAVSGLGTATVSGSAAANGASATGTPGAAGLPNPGTVSFYNGTTLLNSTAVSIVGSTASFTTLTSGPTELPVGQQQITATYNGNSSFAPATSPAITQNVLNTTSTGVSSSLNPSIFGSSVTFMATVTSPAGTPSGTVNFFDGATLLNTTGPITLTGSGTATFATSSLIAGPHNITAVFNTNPMPSGFFTSTGTLTPVQNVTPASTSVALVSSSTPIAGVPTSVFGQAVTFTATVTSPGGTPSGTTVQFLDNGNLIGTGTLNSSGVAVFMTSNLAVATHPITAMYVATNNYNSNTSNTVSQAVTADATTTMLQSSSNPAVFGQTVTFTATVTANSPGSATPGGVANVLAGGTVDFLDNGVQIGTGTLNSSGQATFPTSILSVATHPITAVYVTSTDFTTSTSNQVNQGVTADGTTTTLATSVSPSVYTQLVTFTATVTANSPGSGVPTGGVNFFADGNVNPLNGSTPVTLDGSGHATFATNALTVGTHNITATYLTTTDYTTSTSAVLSQQVGLDGTSTILTTTGSPSVYTQAVTFTATVTGAAPGGGPASGFVTFTDTSTGQTLQPNVALNSLGVATYTTSTLTVGLHNIVANFSANPSFTASSSPAVGQVVKANGTYTAISSSLNPAGFGQSVTFTATVTAGTTPGGVPASGTVSFIDTSTGQTLASNLTLNASGQASFSTSALTGGTHNIVASFSATTNFNASTSAPVAQAITAANTKTTVASLTNPSVYGQAVTFTATVAPSGGGSGTPTGTVTFLDNGVPMGTGTLNGSGVASFTTGATQLAEGVNAITATYGATANFNTSTSSPVVNQQVNADPTTTTVNTSLNPSVYGQAVTFTATVFANSPGSGVPTGGVNFYDGTTLLTTSGPVPVVNNQAAFLTSALNVGGHAITATYVDTTDSNYATSSSASGSLTETVTPDGTNISVGTSLTPSVYAQAVTLTATVSAALPGGGVPSGTVTFYNNGNPIGTGTLSTPGAYTLTTGTLPVGTDTITAGFTATTDYYGSNSPSISQVVHQASTTTVLSTSLTPVVYSQAITLTAVVMSGGSPASGSVTFTDLTKNLALQTVALDNTGIPGTAVFTFNTLQVGSHNIMATFTNSLDFSGSTSNTVTQVVTTAKTTTAVTSNATLVSGTTYTAVYSQPVTFTAVVSVPATGTPSAAGLPAGSVTFKSGATTLGSAALAYVSADSDYEASFTTSATALPVNASPGNSITAVFNPSNTTNFTASTSPAISQEVTADGTTVTVTSNVNPSVVKTAVLLTAVVAANTPGAGTPTGTVNFYVDGSATPINSTPVTLIGGKANFTIPGTNAAGNPILSFGTHTIEAVYNGSSGFLGSNNSGNLYSQGVFYSSKTTLALFDPTTNSKTASYYGDTVTFTATIAAATTGTGVPPKSPTPPIPSQGSVTFFDGTTILVSGVPFSSPGVVIFTTDQLSTPLAIGTHKITAQFEGDGFFYAGSTSAVVTETVYAQPNTIVATVPNPPTKTGQDFTIVVQLYDINGTLITSSPLAAVVTQVGGPAGGYPGASAGFTGGSTDAFILSDQKFAFGTTSSDPYVLQITVGDLTTTVTLTNIIGRLK